MAFWHFILIVVLSANFRIVLQINVCSVDFANAPYEYHGNMVKAAPETVLKVTCRKQYLENEPEIICKDGTWTDPVPPCELVYCDVPHQPKKGSMIMPCRGYDCWTTYSCPEGSWYNGTQKIYCQRDNTWTGAPGECEVVECPLLDDPENGRILQPDRNYSKKAEIVCNEGYFYNPSNSTTRQCLANWTWTPQEGHCQAVKCSRLSAPNHGQIDQQNFTYLAKATVVCDEGYIYSEAGSFVRECQSDNTWSGEEGVCDAVPCPNLPEVENGILTQRGGRFGDKVILQCPSGHILDGPSSATCQADGTWSTELGTCSKPQNQVGVILPAVLVPTLVLLFAIGFVLLWRRHHKSHHRSKDEEMPLLDKCELHCSFKLSEDFSDEYSQRDSNEYSLFSSVIREEIINALKSDLKCTSEVTIIDINQAQKTIFIDVRPNVYVSQSDLSSTLKIIVIKAGKDFHVNPDSFVFRGSITNILAADIMRKRHAPDKGLDRVIDLDTQYVRLKLLSNKTLGTMHRDELERPDVYQHGLEKEDGTEIQDEDLLKGVQPQKYILIRGRAGIGKSTLLQSILWKWANGNIAARFKGIFMLNLRYLITVHKKMNLPRVLCLYAVYGMQTVAVDEKWLEDNQGHIGIILDGIDEIQMFKDYWNTDIESRDSMKPIEWCLAIMKRAVLSRSTVIVSSRPFADLRLIESHMRSSKLSKHLHRVELMGLTRRRVFEFVEKNVPEERKEFVKETLKNNPILMSVSAITFYCAALCEVLGKEDIASLGLRTYTAITAYIMQAYMHRSLKGKEDKFVDTIDGSGRRTLHLLSQLAFKGLLGEGSEGFPRLVFRKRDFDEMILSDGEMQAIRKVGLLMETDIQDPDDQTEVVTLSQFVHLSIQEFLAMAGLLKKGPDEIEMVLKKISASEQLTMTLLFLYGLAFDEENLTVMNLSETGQSRLSEGVPDTLRSAISYVSDDLQALQIAHESQSQVIAEAVGKQRFKDTVHMKGTKLTVIDIIAMLFVLNNHASVQTISLEHIGLDEISVNEIAGFLRKNTTVKTLELNDDDINDDSVLKLMENLSTNETLNSVSVRSSGVTDVGIEHIAAALKQNETILELKVDSDGITDRGLSILAQTLRENTCLEELSVTSDRVTDNGLKRSVGALVVNKSLKFLSLTSNGITGTGVKDLEHALKENKTLQRLSLQSSKIIDDGVEYLSEALSGNKSVNELWLHGFHMRGAGAGAILDLLRIKENLQVRMWTPDCTESVLREVRSHPKITLD